MTGLEPGQPAPAVADAAPSSGPAERVGAVPTGWAVDGGRLAVVLIWLGAALIASCLPWVLQWNDGYRSTNLLLSTVIPLLVAVATALAAVVLPVVAGRRALAAAAWLLTGLVLIPANSNENSNDLLALFLWWVVPSVLLTLGWLIGRRRSGRAFALGLPASAVGGVLMWMLDEPFWSRFWELVPYSASSRWFAVVPAAVFTSVPAVLGAWAAAAVDPSGRRRAVERAAARPAVVGYAPGAVATGAVAADGSVVGYVPLVPRTNGLAVVALVMSLVGFLSVPAIVCGHIARSQIRRTGEGGDGMALAGLIIGYLGLTVLVIYLVYVIAALHQLSQY